MGACASPHLPDVYVFSNFDCMLAVPAPKEKSHVFIRVKEDIGNYVVDPNSEEDPLELQADNVYMIPYASIRPLVEDHRVELI